MKKFEVGDVVALKSGGPRMTVKSVEPTERGQKVFVTWQSSGTPTVSPAPLAPP